MPKIKYAEKRFTDEKLRMIRYANQTCEQYARDGYDLTLRQLYYVFVARNLFPESRKYRWTGRKYVKDAFGTKNALPNYNWLGDLISDARMAGLIDWNQIVDRTRAMRHIPHFNDPQSAMQDAERTYFNDLWARQPTYVEVWVEKDALVGIVQRAASANDVPFFSCRGYTSQSEMWGAAQRIGRKLLAGKDVTILHLGDHDPSGIDMTRDIRERLMLFIKRDQTNLLSKTAWSAADKSGLAGTAKRLSDLPEPLKTQVFAKMREAEASWGQLTIDRIALNMNQIEQYAPPPNPAKMTDPRAKAYVEEHGDESWELDALTPDVLDRLIQSEIAPLVGNRRAWDEDEASQEADRGVMAAIADNWNEIVEYARTRAWIE